MHVYKPPPVGGLDRVPVFTAGTGTTRADLFELDGVTPMPGNVLVADTGGNLPSFQCATSPVYVGVSGSRTAWTPSESGPSTAASGASETLLIQLWQDGFFDGNIHVTVDPTASVADPLAGQAGACRQLILPPVAIASGGICGVTVANNGTAAVVVASVALTVSNLTGTETFQASASDVTVAAGAWVGVDMTGSAGAGTHLSWDAVGQNVATDAADVFWAQLRVQLAPNS